MDTLVDKLFQKKQANAIRKLWDDKSSRPLLRQEIGKQLIATDTVIDKVPLAQLMLIMSLSSFSDSPEECSTVAAIVYLGIKRNDILPMVSEHRGKELAFRCLISLGFFKTALIRRWKRHAAPSPGFYRDVGIKSFGQIGMDYVSSHFRQ